MERRHLRLDRTVAARPVAARRHERDPARRGGGQGLVTEFAGENTRGRTVVAPWQEYWYDDQFGKRGNAWAPELHYFRGSWYIVACMGDHSRKVGSFLLISEGGPEGPYRVAQGNLAKPFGDSFVGGPAFVLPGAYHHIDGGLFSEGDDAWLVLHNNLYARFRDDMEDIFPTTGLPAFQQSPYSPEPYLEGAYVLKYGGKYYLMHAAWDRSSTDPDGSARNAYDPPAPGRVQYQYDLIMAVSDRFRARTRNAGPRVSVPATTTSSSMQPATCGRPSSGTPRSATGRTPLASRTPRCPESSGWSGQAPRATACTCAAADEPLLLVRRLVEAAHRRVVVDVADVVHRGHPVVEVVAALPQQVVQPCASAGGAPPPAPGACSGCAARAGRLAGRTAR